MTRWALLFLSTFATWALADIPPANSSQCRDAAAGSACTTDDGKAGTCVSSMVSRPDYSAGFPPKTMQVPMLLCVASASAREHTTLPFSLGLGLLIAVVGVIALVRLVAGTRGRRAVASR